MRLPALAPGAGRTLTSNDIPLTCHELVRETDAGVILKSKGMVLDIATHSRIAVLTDLYVKDLSEFWALVGSCKTWNRVRTDFTLPLVAEVPCNADDVAALVTVMLRQGAFREGHPPRVQGSVYSVAQDGTHQREIRALAQQGWIEAEHHGWILSSEGYLVSPQLATK